MAQVARLTDSVLTTTTLSGPAAAMMPFEDATPSKDEVGGGRASRGHGDRRTLTLASPFIDWKPSCCLTVSNIVVRV